MEVYLYSLHFLIYNVARELLNLADSTTKRLLSEMVKKEILISQGKNGYTVYKKKED